MCGALHHKPWSQLSAAAADAKRRLSHLQERERVRALHADDGARRQACDPGGLGVGAGGAAMVPCTATFVDNLGTASGGESALVIDKDTYVFGHPSDWYKMVAVDANGKFKECRYMNKNLPLTAQNWASANRGGAYTVRDVKMCN